MPATLPAAAVHAAMPRRARGLRIALPWLLALVAALAQALAPTLLRAGASVAGDLGIEAALRALCTQGPAVAAAGRAAADGGGTPIGLASAGDCAWCLLGAAPPPSIVSVGVPGVMPVARVAPWLADRPRTGAVLAAAEARGPPAPRLLTRA